VRGPAEQAGSRGHTTLIVRRRLVPIVTKKTGNMQKNPARAKPARTKAGQTKTGQTKSEGVFGKAYQALQPGGEFGF